MAGLVDESWVSDRERLCRGREALQLARTVRDAASAAGSLGDVEREVRRLRRSGVPAAEAWLDVGVRLVVPVRLGGPESVAQSA